MDGLSKANEFITYLASTFQPNTIRKSDVTTNLDDNKPNTFPLVKFPPSICCLQNYVFGKKIMPTDCEEATVLPMFKKDDRSQPANYRPISLIL